MKIVISDGRKLDFAAARAEGMVEEDDREYSEMIKCKRFILRQKTRSCTNNP